MNKEYKQPIVSILTVTDDIMLGSDTFVDVGGLWTEEQN